ncbi:hypothetical protein, partial [Mycobacterium avium]
YRKPGTEDLDVGPQANGAAVSYFAPQLFTTGFTPLPVPDESDTSAAPEVVDDVAEQSETNSEADDEASGAALMRP